jgi:hypothetical protein
MIPVLVLMIAGGWLVWFQTRPVYDAAQWDDMFGQPELIMYLFNPNLSGAARILSDGLVRELGRSGALSPGYPKLRTAPWPADELCVDKNLVLSGKYFIQLSETQDNYIEILCGRNEESDNVGIYLLPAFPWSRLDYSAYQQIAIGFSSMHNSVTDHHVTHEQRGLILNVLKNIGVKLYVDKNLQYLIELKNKQGK